MASITISEVNMEIARILGVSEKSISALDEEIKSSMRAVFDTFTVQNDEDKIAVYEALDKLWQKGSVLIGLEEVSDATGILLTTLKNLDYETQEKLVGAYMMDSTDYVYLYEIVNDALAVSDIDNVAKLIDVPASELRKLPRELQKQLCGAYLMEQDEDSDNAELIDELREMIADNE